MHHYIYIFLVKKYRDIVQYKKKKGFYGFTMPSKNLLAGYR